MAHLSDLDRTAYLAGLGPGEDVDHRGTTFDEQLLGDVLAAVQDPLTRRACIGRARFDQVQFNGTADFNMAQFKDNAEFHKAQFNGTAWFNEAQFGGTAWFNEAQFGDIAGFYAARFGGTAWFAEAQFGPAWFHVAQFNHEVWFGGAQFEVDAEFGKATFDRTTALGPLTCAGTLDLSEAVFGSAVTIEAAASAVSCRRTRWLSTAALRLRHAAIDLSDAVLEYPVSVAARPRPFVYHPPIHAAAVLPEPGLTDPRVRITSLRGVDAAHLVLTDVDLTTCLFAGTIHLDQLRLEGNYRLAGTPTGLRRRRLLPVRWTPRRTLAEEHHWRAARHRDTGGWTPAPLGEDVLDPTALAPLYRQLRKAFEDGKHEPGAADFYYGEMEMRRQADDIPRGERGLLTAYWALSGYGLRASRALGWLLAAMTATVLALMLWGLPKDGPKPQSTGKITGDRVTFTTETPAPVNPDGPYSERLSTDRFEKSLRVVVNSVVFRSSGQDLTTTGTYVEMVSRFAEPVLLGLVVLAVRSRVKR